AGGQVGWVAAEFLAPVASGGTAASPAAPPPSPAPPSSERQYQVTHQDVNLREGPGLGGAVLAVLDQGAPVLGLDAPPGAAVGHEWRQGGLAGGQVGWVAAEFLAPASGSAPTGGLDGTGLPNDPDHQFSFAELWPAIAAAAVRYGTDGRIVAAIVQQESGFR